MIQMKDSASRLNTVVVEETGITSSHMKIAKHPVCIRAQVKCNSNNTFMIHDNYIYT